LINATDNVRAHILKVANSFELLDHRRLEHASIVALELAKSLRIDSITLLKQISEFE
jgi:hypothetical protein